MVNTVNGAPLVESLPFTPGSAFVVERLESVDFLAIVTPVLAYAGLALTRQENGVFHRSGWKMLLTAMLVFIGTFLASALIADLML